MISGWTEAAAYHVDDVAVLPRLAQAGVHADRPLSQLPSPGPHRAAAADRRLWLSAGDRHCHQEEGHQEGAGFGRGQRRLNGVRPPASP